MSKKNKVAFNSIWISSILVSTMVVLPSSEYGDTVLAKEKEGEGIVIEIDEVVAPEEEQAISSIQLNPGMYIPEKEMLLNKEVDRNDVIKTMNLKDIMLATDTSLAEIDAGIFRHLGYSEGDLTEVQVSLYDENVIHYSKEIQAVTGTAIEEEEVTAVLEEFNAWIEAYKTAIAEEKQLELEAAEKAKEEAEQEEKAKLIEATEVVDHSPNSETPIMDYVSYGIPELGDQYLTYMPYTAITAKTTPHYRLQQIATTDKHGYRIHEGAVAIALASSYGTTIGTLYDIKFSDGKVMRAILGDNKSDKHTDSNKQYRDATGAYDGRSGNIVEIIFDVTNYPDMNSVNRKINSDYSGEVISIVKVGMAEGFGQ